MHIDVQSLAIGAALGPLAFWLLKKVLEEIKASGKADTSKRNLRVVVTGSSRGLGLALADHFLQLGDRVLVTSRTTSTVNEAVQSLKEKHPSGVVHGHTCDVSRLDDVESLALKATEVLGGIDIWVNNAGVSNTTPSDVTEIDSQKAQEVVATNLFGSLWGSRAAIAQMKTQSSGGRVFLMDGTGAWGNPTPKNLAYGATKRALTQLKDSLAIQMKGSKVSVHMASPGMVATPLLFDAIESARSAKFVNILAESTANVAAWLVPRMRGTKRNGSYIKFLTPRGVLWRLMTFSSRKDRFVDTNKFVKTA